MSIGMIASVIVISVTLGWILWRGTKNRYIGFAVCGGIFIGWALMHSWYWTYSAAGIVIALGFMIAASKIYPVRQS